MRTNNFTWTPIYEVVSGQVLLSRRLEFFKLHGDVLLPMMDVVGIRPVLLLFTEVGRYGRFTNIYRYEDLADYATKTEGLLSNPRMEDYYRHIGETIHGSILVELMRELPYARKLQP